MKMTKELFAARACSKIWKVIEASPWLTKLEKNASGLWGYSRLLIHPYVQLDRGFVFIHVPKTAGSSISEALGLDASSTRELHRPARDVLPFLKIVAPDIISVAFVRNPYERFVSLYNFAREAESLYHSVKNPESAKFGKHADYDMLIDKNLEECAELLVEGKLGDRTVRLRTWHPQIDWLVDRDGKIMVDFIGHVETLEADLQKLSKLHGIAINPVPWKNKSGAQEAHLQLTERACELIRLYYKRDFEILGYDENVPSALVKVHSAA